MEQSTTSDAAAGLWTRLRRFGAWAGDVGWPTAILVALEKRLPDPVLRITHSRLIRNDLAAMPPVGGCPDDMEIRWARPEEIMALSPRGFDARTIARLGTSQARCVLALTRDGVLAGIHLYHQREYQSANSPIRVRLAPDQVWMTYSYVEPAFRGARLAANLSAFARDAFLREGIRCRVAIMRIQNNAAWASVRPRGIDVLGETYCVTILGVTFFRFQDAWKIRITGFGRAIPFDLATLA